MPNWSPDCASAIPQSAMADGLVIGQLVGGPRNVPRAAVVATHVVAAPVQPQPDASHRLNHKMLHITLSALGVDEVSNEAVLHMAQSKGALMEYSIGDEVHPNPADQSRPRHKHFYLKYADSINHRDARYCSIFDMRGFGGRVLHPHIQGVGPKKKDRAAVIYYTQKDKLYIASPHLMNYNQEATSAGWAIEMNSVETVREGMLMLQQRHPQVFYMHSARIQHGLEMRIGYSERSAFKLEDFTRPPIPANLLARKAVVLQGESHIGKTQFALAHFEFPLLVSEIDDLKYISLRTDGIVFDQMRFVHPEDRSKLNLNADQTIRLLDVELSRSIGARYHNARVPRGMPRIFITNRRVDGGEPIFPRGGNAAEQEGIDSRVEVSEWMIDDLRKNPGPNARGA